MSTGGADEARGRFSVVRILDAWYALARSRDLGSSAPLARTLLGTPLALFRGGERRAAAVLDRCAHRNAPLSSGRSVAGRLECPYHGWQYDAGGVCRFVPALRDGAEGRGRRVPSFATIEQQGYIWVYGRPDAVPAEPPFRFPYVDEPGYATLHFRQEVEGSLHATLENMLDVPHTGFLHRGLFRSGRRNEISAVVRRWSDRVEAEYRGEPRPSGLVGRILAPEGGTVEHIDRFILPAIAQVEYRLGRSHLVITNALAPVSEFVTRFHAIVSFRLPIPGALLRPVLGPVVRRILAQDARILQLQSDSVRRAGGEQYVSTDVDLLGPHVWRLLRQAAETGIARDSGSPEIEREVRLLV